jgi:hypothetical protein
MGNAAVGFRVHSGWAAMVAVSLEKGEPVVLCRERAHLVKIFNYSYRQPYHTAEKMQLEEARAFISQVRTDARSLACGALRGMQARVQEAGYRLSRSAMLLASGRELPELEKILASHALIHTADGELFREALLHGSDKCGFQTLQLREKELLGQAAKVLGSKEAALLKRVTELGKPMGSPWSQDEKFATLAAWLALSSRSGDERLAAKAKAGKN